jgi:hypothetical protein
MSPQEKAKELFSKHYIICQEYTEEIQCSIQAKQCALASVEEIIKYVLPRYQDFTFAYYWEDVKKEIKKI